MIDIDLVDWIEMSLNLNWYQSSGGGRSTKAAILNGGENKAKGKEKIKLGFSKGNISRRRVFFHGRYCASLTDVSQMASRWMCQSK